MSISRNNEKNSNKKKEGKKVFYNKCRIWYRGYNVNTCYMLLFIYTVLSANFKDTLVDYSLSLMEFMTTQGIDGVERELENNLTESIFNSKKYRFGKGYNRRNF